MEAKERNKLIDELKPKVLKLPMSEVVDSRLHGSRLSPFREDNHIGSFSVSDEQGCCTDFVEGKTRNQITFIKDYDGVDFQEAVLRLGCEFGLIEESIYKEASKNQGTFKIKKVKIPEKPKVNQAERQDEEFTHYVYSLMLKLGLYDYDRDYLLKRGISENELKRYFSYDDSKTPLIKYWMLGDHQDVKRLLGIPGFYLEKGVIEKRSDIKGIGIPMYNANGNITAIQIRRSEVSEGQARYVFLSSRGLEMGCSCGAQVTIEEPFIDGDVYITEGHFKAVEIRKHFGSTAISVQGVNNIKPLEIEIPNLLKRRKISRFILAFDADMKRNPAVKRALLKLSNNLSQYGIPIVYMVWDEKYGKGIDDVIQAGHADKLEIKENIS